MKRILPILLAIILTVVIFTGCNSLFPLDKDQFDLGDTVKVHVGEMVYESPEFWGELTVLKTAGVQLASCVFGPVQLKYG
jgi:hypothetical protein